RKPNRRLSLLVAVTHFLPVTPVLGVQHLDLLSGIEEAVGPAVIDSLGRRPELLRGILPPLFRRPLPVLRQLITAVATAIQRPTARLDRHGHGIPKPGGEALGVRRRLSRLPGIEAPDPGALLQLG